MGRKVPATLGRDDWCVYEDDGEDVELCDVLAVSVKVGGKRRTYRGKLTGVSYDYAGDIEFVRLDDGEDDSDILFSRGEFWR